MTEPDREPDHQTDHADEPVGFWETMLSLARTVGVVALVLAGALLLQSFVVKPFKIPSESMASTLVPGDRVLVNRASLRFGDPKVGDVVVFWAPANIERLTSECTDRPEGPGRFPCRQSLPERSDLAYIKRVVAVGGDRVTFEGGRLYRNGELIDEDYARPCKGAGCTFDGEIEVPEDHFYMVGDNRGHSNDSRFWGAVPRENLIGKAFATYWPFGHLGGL